jgi:hypothetical protein
VKPVELLRTIPEVRERYRARFPVVLVDEYQDTNHAQYVLLQAAGGRERRTCSWWATTTSPSTAGAAPTCATSWTSRRTFPHARV